MLAKMYWSRKNLWIGLKKPWLGPI